MHRKVDNSVLINTQKIALNQRDAYSKLSCLDIAIVDTFDQKFTLIPPGTFLMGSVGDEADINERICEVQHQVTLTKGFYMGVTPITQAQWRAIMIDYNPYNYHAANRPAFQVNWDDIEEFIEKLNGKATGYHYRLPTESEWEYACRAGSIGAYANNLDSMGWYYENNKDGPQEVGLKKGNAWGLYDMHGNVEEWCQDWWDFYPDCRVVNPIGENEGNPFTCYYRVIRGGSCLSSAERCRSASRRALRNSHRHYDIGFRLAITNC